MKILHVIASLQGGAARHVLTLARGLRAEGATVEVAVPDDHLETARRFREAGCRLYPMALDKGFDAGAAGYLRALFEGGGYDIAHIHGLRAGLMGRVATHQAGMDARVVYTLHGFHVPFYESAAKRLLATASERWLAPWTGRFLFVSEADRDAFFSAVGRGIEARSLVIPNGIPIEDYACDLAKEEARRRLELPDGTFLIGTASRLRPQKDVPTLLAAFAHFRRKHPASHLVIAGDGPLRGEVEGLIRQMGLDGRVTLRPHVEEMAVFYRALDAFTLTSRWEGLPLVLLEALAARCPAVATEVAGTTEVMTNMQEGLLVPAGDPEALAKAWHCVLTNPADAERMVENGRKKVESRFGAGEMVRRTLEVYRDLWRGRA